MAGIQESETIDLVAQAADGRYLLVMVETRPWGTDPAQPNQLKAKIKTYAQYALDGGLLSHFPQVASQAIVIRLDCSERPDDEIAAITTRAAERLARFDIEFTVNVNPQLWSPAAPSGEPPKFHRRTDQTDRPSLPGKPAGFGGRFDPTPAVHPRVGDTNGCLQVATSGT